MSETIPQYLARVSAKDAEKGGTGWRTTREVADFFGISVSAARGRLTTLSNAGQIEVAQEVCSPGSPLVWRAL